MKNNAIRMVVKFILHSSFFIYFYACRNGEGDETEEHDEDEEVLIADTFGNES